MTFLIELLTIVVYCIYVYLVLEVQRLSIIWGWAAELLYWMVILALALLYMRSGRWTTEKI